VAGKEGRRAWGWVRRMPSSRRFQASYIGPDLLRHYGPGTYEHRMDAEYWLSAERRLIDQGLWTSPKLRAAQRKAKKLTFGEYADRWIEHRNIKPSTRTEYTRLMAGPLAPLAPVELRDISAETVRSWFASLPDTPRRNSHAYGLVHAVFATAVSDGLIIANPCVIKGVMNPPRRREPVILTPAELAAVADAIRPEQLRCLVLVSAWCGLRWGEVIELRRKDIDKSCEVVMVSRAASHRGKGCRIDTPKSGRARAVIVPPHIREDLQEHLARYVAKGTNEPIFPALRYACHFNDSVFAKHFAKAAGRDDIRIHDLRHFAGTQAARVGSVTEVMDRLGHSTPRASLMYQGLASGRARELAEALSELAEGDNTDTTNDN
jgi:integrase